jgi:hypothetical protein
MTSMDVKLFRQWFGSTQDSRSFYLFLMLGSMILSFNCTTTEVNTTDPAYINASWRLRWGAEPEYEFIGVWTIGSTESKFENDLGYRIYPIQMPAAPSSPPLEYQSPTALVISTKNFMDAYQDVWDAYQDVYNQPHYDYWESTDKNLHSYLIGLNSPVGYPSTNPSLLGFSFTRGMGSGYFPGISFIFPGNPDFHDQVSGLRTTELTYTVMHELGHSRGLKVDGGETYDHNNHLPTNSDCMMRAPMNIPYTGLLIFCERHKQILRECLFAIHEGYDPAATCAILP